MAEINGTAGADTLDGTEAADTVSGLAGDDTLKGNGGNDRLLAGTGYDVLLGGNGDDELYFGADFTTADYANGGAGTDKLMLQGAYAAMQIFGAGQVYNIERLELLSGSDTRFGDAAGKLYSYNLRTDDANIAAGQTLTVDFSGLTSGENAIFDGKAETDGKLAILGGAGNDTLTGGAGNDTFTFGAGRWGSGDSVDGGGGSDKVSIQLAAGYNTMTFAANQLVGIETIELRGAYSDGAHQLTLSDADVAAGQTLTIDAVGFLPTIVGPFIYEAESFIFDGSAETDGNLDVSGSFGDDVLIAGHGHDRLYGAGGYDQIYFGASFGPGDFARGGTQAGLYLQGNYADPLMIDSTMMQSFTSITLLRASDNSFGQATTGSLTYNLRLSDFETPTYQHEVMQPGSGIYETVHPPLTVSFGGLAAEDYVIFGARGEPTDDMVIIGGAAYETLASGGGDDLFRFDVEDWSKDDSIDGWSGSDTLALTVHNQNAAIAFAGNQLFGIEAIDLIDSGSASLLAIKLDDGNVVAGTLDVDGTDLDAACKLIFDGSAELESSLHLVSGYGNDVLIGGAAGDRIVGGRGADSLTGGGGNDVFAYGALAESTAAAPDRIEDFRLGDLIDLATLDANSTVTGNQAFTLIGGAAFSHVAGELRAPQVSGSDWLIQADTDGDGVANLELHVILADGDPITASDFVL